MKKINFENLLSNGGKETFISPIEEKLYAYKLSREQAVNFSHRFSTIQEVEDEYGEKNLLKMNEKYEGWILLILDEGLVLGYISGTMEYLDPKKVQMLPLSKRSEAGSFAKRTILTDSRADIEAQQGGRLFSLSGEFKKCLVIVRDMEIAKELTNDRRMRDPKGTPVKVEKIIHDKLVKGLLAGMVDLTEAEEYCIKEHFINEAMVLFRE